MERYLSQWECFCCSLKMNVTDLTTLPSTRAMQFVSILNVVSLLMRLNFAATPRRAASRHYNWSLIATWYAQSCAERCTPVRAGSVWESAWPTAAVGTRGAALWEMPPRFQATHKLSAGRLGVGEDLCFFLLFSWRSLWIQLFLLLLLLHLSID